MTSTSLCRWWQHGHARTCTLPGAAATITVTGPNNITLRPCIKAWGMQCDWMNHSLTPRLLLRAPQLTPQQGKAAIINPAGRRGWLPCGALPLTNPGPPQPHVTTGAGSTTLKL